MSMDTEQVSFGLNGSYDEAVRTWRDAGGNLNFQDIANPAGKTLSQILAGVGSHAISSHSEMGTDFATQYFNQDRAAAYLGNTESPVPIATALDKMGNNFIGLHVADGRLHQRIPKFVLRVSPEGQDYSTIQAAIDAIPTAGGTMPGAEQWWAIEVGPGVYNERVNLNKSYVMVLGRDARACFIKATTAGGLEPPVRVSASYTVLRGFTIKNTSGETEGRTPAVRVGPLSGVPTVGGVELDGCVLTGPVYGVLTISTGSGATLLGCGVTSTYSDPVAIEGTGSFQECTFTVPAGGGAATVDGGTATFVRCQQVSGAKAFTVIDASVSATDYACEAEVELFAVGLDNVASAITVARVGGKPPATVAGVTVTVDPEIGLASRGDVLIDWVTLRKFRSGYGASGTPAVTGAAATGSDHLFVRDINHEAPSSGDVVEIADRCSSGTTNGLKLLLAGSTGKFVRWVGKVGAVETELGYIAKDGTIYAPGLSTAGATVTPTGISGASFSVHNEGGDTEAWVEVADSAGDPHRVLWSSTAERWKMVRDDNTTLEDLEARGLVLGAGGMTVAASQATSADMAGATFDAAAAHASGVMALLRSMRVKAPTKPGAGTVTDAIALDVEAVSGVGATSNLSARFRGAVRMDGAVNLSNATTAAAGLQFGSSTSQLFASGNTSYLLGQNAIWLCRSIAALAQGIQIDFSARTSIRNDAAAGLLIDARFGPLGLAAAGEIAITPTGANYTTLSGGTVKASSTLLGFFGAAPAGKTTVGAFSNPPTQAECETFATALRNLGLIG